MSTVTFREFETDARSQGFDEVLERNWAPGVVLDVHVHPFAVKALVVRGEMWLRSAKTPGICARETRSSSNATSRMRSAMEARERLTGWPDVKADSND